MASPDFLVKDVEVLKDWRLRVDGRLDDHDGQLDAHNVRIGNAELKAAVRDEDIKYIKDTLDKSVARSRWAIGLLVMILVALIPLVYDFIKWGLTHNWAY